MGSTTKLKKGWFKLEAYFPESDVQILRRNGLQMRLYRYDKQSGMLSFETQKPKELFKWLDRNLDFGATTPADVFNFHMLHDAAEYMWSR